MSWDRYIYSYIYPHKASQDGTFKLLSDIMGIPWGYSPIYYPTSYGSVQK